MAARTKLTLSLFVSVFLLSTTALPTAPSSQPAAPSPQQQADLSGDLAAPAWLPARDTELLKSKIEDGIITIHAVVSADGTGNHTTIGAAIDAAPRRSSGRFVVHVKAGIYHEYLNVGEDVWNLILVGEGMDNTVVTGNKSVKGGCNTMSSATVTVQGVGFIAQDISFENTAGALMNQAVALLSSSDKSVLLRCGLRGYQDTLYAYSKVQFYRECHIYGTVDFIFGDAAALFQNCTIFARLPIKGQPNTITAQGRLDPTKNTGFSFQHCTVSADDELARANFTVKTFLGRPWTAYSRVVFMQSYLSQVVDPEGWIPWNESRFNLDTLYYGEFSNGGPGASLTQRVTWPGVHNNLTASEASNFTAKILISGDEWLSSTGVNYTSGL